MALLCAFSRALAFFVLFLPCLALGQGGDAVFSSEKELVKADSLLTLAIKNSESDVDFSSQMANDALLLISLEKDTTLYVKYLRVIAALECLRGDYSQSIGHAFEALKLLEMLPASAKTADLSLSIYTSIANVYNDIDLHGTALRYRMLSLEQALLTGDSMDIFLVYFNMGDDYRNLGDFEKALYYTDSALYISQKAGKQNELGNVYGNIGEIYADMGLLASAFSALDSAIDILEGLGEAPSVAYFRKVRAKALLEEGKYAPALQDLLKALEYFNENSLNNQKMDVFSLLATAYEGLGQYEKAVQALAEGRETGKLYFSEEKARQFTQLQASYELESKQRQIDILRDKTRLQKEVLAQQSTNLYSQLFLLGIVGFFLFLIVKNAATRQRANKTLALKQALIESQHTDIKAKNLELETKNLQLEKLDNEKTFLLNTVAHDLRNPLNQVIGFMQLLRLDSQALNEAQRNYIQKAVGASERLRKMIGDILNESLLAEHGLSVSVGAHSLAPLVVQVVESLTAQAQDKGIGISFEQPPATLPQALLDPGFAIPIIDNLLSNAVKYSPKNSNITVWVRERNGFCDVGVQDEGPGISAEEQHKLFRRFQKLSAKPTAGEDSIGLGLSIVKKYIDAMQGEVWCESDGKNGSLFVAAFRCA